MERNKVYKKKVKDLRKKKLPKVIIILILLLVILCLLIFTIFKFKKNKKVVSSDIEIRIENDNIEWQYKKGKWQKLATVLELTGITSDDMEIEDELKIERNLIELRKTDTHIEWSYIDRDEWTPIIAIDDLCI